MGSAPGSFRTDCPQRGCAGQWARLRGGPSRRPPRVPSPAHVPSRKRRERRPHPRGRGKETSPVLSSGNGPVALPSPPRIPAAPHPARFYARAPRAPGRPPDSPRPSRGRPVGAGAVRRPVGFSDVRPPTRSLRLGTPGRSRVAPGAPPAGRPGTDASGGERPGPSEVRQPSCSPAPPPRRPAAPSAWRAAVWRASSGAVTGCPQPPPGSGALSPRPLCRRCRQRPSLPLGLPALSTSPPPYRNCSATLCSAPGATYSAWGWDSRRKRLQKLVERAPGTED